jgi:transcriptional regulator with XRE-family HTH domain
MLRATICESSLRTVAKKFRVSPSYLSDVMNGKRDIGPKLAKALKLRKVREVQVWFEPIR